MPRNARTSVKDKGRSGAGSLEPVRLADGRNEQASALETAQTGSSTCANAELRKSCVQSDAVALSPSGELTIADAAELHEKLLRALGGGLELSLDLGQVTYADAAILQLLSAAQKSAAVRAGKVVLRNVSEPLVRDAKTVGLGAVLQNDSDDTQPVSD